MLVILIYSFLSAVLIFNTCKFGYYMTKQKSNLYGKIKTFIFTVFAMLSIFALSIVLA